MNLISNICVFIQLILILNICVNIVMANDKKLDDVFKGAQNVKCSNKTDKKAEDLLPLLVPMGTDQRIPENRTELRKFCNNANKHMPFILGVFKYCTSQFTRTVARFVFFPIRKQLDNTCKAGKPSRTATELMKAGKCGNLAKDRLKECNNNLIDALNGISLAPIKSRIQMTCCHSNVYQQCLREATEDTVGCTRHSIDWAERFVMKMIGGSVSMGCGDYFEESDKCKKLINETPKPNYSETNKRPKSFIKPMLTLMESLPNPEIE